jgi:AraC-like DNA-binding protein
MYTEFPYVLHVTDFSETNVPWHWHEAFEFGYTTKGSVQVDTTDGSYIFPEGEGYFINSNVLSTMHIEKGRDAAVNEASLFHPVFLAGHFGRLFESKYIRPVMDDRQLQLLAIRGKTDRQKKMLTLMRHLSAQDTMKYREFLIRNTVSELWLLLMDEIADTDLSVREVAMRTGFSDTAYFGKVFRENTGMTPLAFHRRYRHQK